MNGNIALFTVAVLRLLVAAAAVAAAYRLASESKEGWGWMLFLAFCALPDSLRFD